MGPFFIVKMSFTLALSTLKGVEGLVPDGALKNALAQADKYLTLVVDIINKIPLASSEEDAKEVRAKLAKIPAVKGE